MTDEERDKLREWLNRKREWDNEPATQCSVQGVEDEIIRLRLELDETNRTLALICAYVARIANAQPDPVAQMRGVKNSNDGAFSGVSPTPGNPWKSDSNPMDPAFKAFVEREQANLYRDLAKDMLKELERQDETEPRTAP